MKKEDFNKASEILKQISFLQEQVKLIEQCLNSEEVSDSEDYQYLSVRGNSYLRSSILLNKQSYKKVITIIFELYSKEIEDLEIKFKEI